MLLDRRHLATQRAAGRIDGILFGEITDPIRGRVLSGKLPDLLRPALAVEHDDPAAGAGSESGLEGLVEILLRHRHLAHELLQRNRRLHDVFDVMPHGNLFVARDAVKPRGHVGRAIRLAEAHGLCRPGNLGIDVGLRNGTLLTAEGLLDQSPGDQDLEHVSTVPLDARGLNSLDLDGLAVDASRHSGTGGSFRRVIHHVFHSRGILEGPEYLARGRPALAFAEVLEKAGPHVLELHVGRRQSIFTLDDDELVGHLHHRRNVARPQCEHRPLEPRVAGMMADRLHPAVCTGTPHVNGMLPSQPPEVVGGGQRLHPQLLRLFLGAGHDDPGLDRLTKLVVERLLHLRGRRFDAGMGQPTQGEHRPDDVFGILPGRDSAFLFDETDPFVSGHAEPLRHGIDLGIDVLWCDGNALPATGLRDDFAIDHHFQDGIAVAAQALGSQLGVRDFSSVDHRHDPVGGSTGRGRFGRGILTRRGHCPQRWLRIGLRRSGETTPEQAGCYHEHSAANLTDRARPSFEHRLQSLAELLPESSHRIALLGTC